MPKDKQEEEETPPKSVPPYGSQEYWEQRYRKDETNQNDNNGDNPDPYHSWYFSFEELKPILLPLLLGREESEEEEGNDNNDNNDIEENDTVEGTDELEKDQAKGTDKAETFNENKNEGNEPQKDDSDDTKNDDNDDDDEWEEVQEGDDEEEQGDEQYMVSREGLAANGPIQVLELGCGDVPLGTALAEELQIFQTATGASALEVCQKIVCTDYSPTVIDKMKRSHEKKRKQDDTESIVPVEFTVADARKLPYEDSSFQLILEKGTMDAMLSDDKDGVSNCIQIVTECARSLTEGGCFFLVSHINAQTTKGEEWLERVVLVGLRKGGPDSSWAIEAHGSDHSGAEEENAAPAVYLIFKRKRQPEDPDKKANSKIPLQFFSY